jgi:hypothetical protein
MGINTTTVGVGIEAQYIGVNPAAGIRLAQRAGRWEEACRILRVPFAYINPTSWQRAELGVARRMRREQVKKLAAMKARAVFGVLPAQHQHAADAALIARFVSIRHQNGGIDWTSTSR